MLKKLLLLPLIAALAVAFASPVSAGSKGHHIILGPTGETRSGADIRKFANLDCQNAFGPEAR